jgi:OOP family OmpA-OmpF porin
MEWKQQHCIFSCVSLAAIAIGLAGCSAGPNADLARARSSLQQAAQTPQVTEHAPVQLREAQQTLDQAERDWEDEGDQQETSHRAYVVEQQAGIAVAVAQQKAAEAQAKQLAEQRDQVRLTAAHRDAQSAKARARQLEQELAALNAKNTDRGLVMTLDPTLFEFNKTTLKPGAMNNLSPLVTFLREHPERQVSIEGHTDSIGSDSYNVDLSQRRADAVRDFLMRNGIRPEQVTTRGYGESFPIASNDNEAGRLQNRRVEIVISHGSERVVDRQGR